MENITEAILEIEKITEFRKWAIKKSQDLSTLKNQ
jgi:hypothetical protein